MATITTTNLSQRNLLLVCTLAALLLAPAVARGQVDPAKQYRKVDPAPWVNDKTEFNRLRFDIPNILRGSLDFRSNQAKLDQYFNQYIFPQMTLYTNADLTELPERRKDFISLIQRVATSQEAHDYVVGLTMATMEKIATADFHPAVRYNAMLIMGEMNSQEAQLIGSTRTPPLPLETALPILLRELDNPDQLDAVRVAALIGIHRHARMESENSKLNRSRFKDADIRQLIDRMLTLIKTNTPPDGRSEEGHIWMQRRAIEVLAEIGKVDAGGSVATELEQIVKNNKAPVDLRCTAARAIGKLSFTTVQNFDALSVAMELGELGVYCCQQEIDRVAQRKQEEEERKLLEQLALQGPSSSIGGPGGENRIQPPRERLGGDPFGGGLLGGELGMTPSEPDWKLLVTKRRLKYQLGSVRLALAGSPLKGVTGQNGLLQRATGAQKASVQSLIDGVDKVLTALDGEVFQQDELLKRVSLQMQPLATIVADNSGSGAAAAGPGAPGPGGLGPVAPAAPGAAPLGPGAPPLGPGAPAPGPGPGELLPGGPAPGPAAPAPGGPGAPAPAAPGAVPGVDLPM